MPERYMLTVQHDEQKVAYIEFQANDDEQAKEIGEYRFKQYAQQDEFFPAWERGTSGNFSGRKPCIVSHHLSKWHKSATATTAWGTSSGGYWDSLRP